MPQLRWALLCLGVLFVGVLAWIERRRRGRQGFNEQSPRVDRESGAQGSPSVGYREPPLTLPEIRARDPGPPQRLPVVEIEDDSLTTRRAVEGAASREEPPAALSLPVLESGPVAPRGRGVELKMSVDSVKIEPTDELARSARDIKVPRPDPPVAPKQGTLAIQIADTADDNDSEERAFNEAVFGAPSPLASRREPDFSDEDAIAEGAIADGAPAQGISAEAATVAAPAQLPGSRRFTAADVTPVGEPIVEWPPDDQRRLISVRLAASLPERFAGRTLRLALASEGFVLGRFQIFHKPDENGRAVLSVASLSNPGTFDPATMDVQRFAGVSLFAVLPGPRTPLKAFDDLLATARNLNERLQGALQDERGGPLTPARIVALREALAAETVP